MYVISSVAEELLAYANVIPEWLCEERQEKVKHILGLMAPACVEFFFDVYHSRVRCHTYYLDWCCSSFQVTPYLHMSSS